MFKEIFYSFRARVFWLTALLVLLLSIFFTAVVIYQQERFLKQDLFTKGTALSKNIAHGSELGVFTENKEFLENNIMQNIDAAGGVVYVVVYNLKLNPIFIYDALTQ